MLAGQAEKHYEDRAGELTRAFDARRCAVRVHKPGQVWLDFYHADALPETIPALPIPRKPGPAAVVVGRIEAGQPWLIRLRDTHLFIAGQPGRARRRCCGQSYAARPTASGAARCRYGESTQRAA